MDPTGIFADIPIAPEVTAVVTGDDSGIPAIRFAICSIGSTYCNPNGSTKLTGLPSTYAN
jgi:hypothetical protein